MLQIPQIIFTLSLINLLIHLSNNSDFFKEFDSNWKETECIPTYGKWGTIDGCKKEDKVSPYDDSKTCWIYILHNKENFNHCEIVFIQPLKTSKFFTGILMFLIFYLFNLVFCGYPLIFLRIVFYIIIFIPILFFIELKLFFVHNEGFHLSRIFLFLYYSSKNSFENIYNKKFIKLYLQFRIINPIIF